MRETREESKIQEEKERRVRSACYRLLDTTSNRHDSRELDKLSTLVTTNAHRSPNPTHQKQKSQSRKTLTHFSLPQFHTNKHAKQYVLRNSGIISLFPQSNPSRKCHDLPLLPPTRLFVRHRHRSLAFVGYARNHEYYSTSA